MQHQNISCQELAERIKRPVSYISKMLKEEINFSLDEICELENNPEYFGFFQTWVHKPDDVLPEYTKSLDDTLMTISFQYTKFDVFVWQKFIDIVDSESNLKTPDRVYKLKNPQTDSIECIIETKRFAEREKGFKMEIL